METMHFIAFVPFLAFCLFCPSSHFGPIRTDKWSNGQQALCLAFAVLPLLTTVADAVAHRQFLCYAN